MAAVGLNGPQDLTRQGKTEQVPDICAVLDEGCSLHSNIHVHVAILVELMSQMGCMCDPWQLSTIELERGRINKISDSWSTHVKTLCLGLGWAGVCGEFQIITVLVILWIFRHHDFRLAAVYS